MFQFHLCWRLILIIHKPLSLQPIIVRFIFFLKIEFSSTETKFQARTSLNFANKWISFLLGLYPPQQIEWQRHYSKIRRTTSSCFVNSEVRLFEFNPLSAPRATNFVAQQTRRTAGDASLYAATHNLHRSIILYAQSSSSVDLGIQSEPRGQKGFSVIARADVPVRCQARAPHYLYLHSARGDTRIYNICGLQIESILGFGSNPNFLGDSFPIPIRFSIR